MRKLVMGLSGGMDSVTLLGIFLEQGYEVHCCNFFYGAKHNQYEKVAFAQVIEYYQSKNLPVIPHSIDLSAAFSDFKSNLLLSGEAIPEGHYEEESMRLTVVPGRNLIFTSIMAGLAESIEADYVALGVHSGDHHIYPDCRDEFIKALNYAVYLGSDQKVKIIAPLINDTKTSILEKGFALLTPIPYHLTRTCYKNQGVSCGKCGSCRERLEAFENIGKTDPIKYEK
jgi:7-cyano-7-deazaguanine synthase